MTTTSRANLGLASTEELFVELIARLGTELQHEIGARPAVERAVGLAKILWSLPASAREYKTVEDF